MIFKEFEKSAPDKGPDAATDSEKGFRPDCEDLASNTIDLNDWFATDLSTTGSFDLGIVAATSFGKLLNALPIPVMLIDWTYSVVFTNQACAAVSSDYKMIQGLPFESLVPRIRNAEKARSLVKAVFRTRKPQIADGILEIDARKIWGRLYFRSIRIGNERYVLLVVENITAEKADILLKHKEIEELSASRRDLQVTVKRRTNQLFEISEKLSSEVARQKAKCRTLSDEIGCLTTALDFTEAGIAVIDRNMEFTVSNSIFKEIFFRESDPLRPLDWYECLAFADKPDSLSAWLGQATDENTHFAFAVRFQHCDSTVNNLNFKIKKSDASFIVVCDRPVP